MREREEPADLWSAQMLHSARVSVTSCINGTANSICAGDEDYSSGGSSSSGGGGGPFGQIRVSHTDRRAHLLALAELAGQP